MAKIIVDGTDAVFGRVGSFVSKELLKGNSVDLINCEKIVVSGSLSGFVEKIRAKIRMGQGGSMKGPGYVRKEDLLVKRMIRGMLPWDRPKGREAHKRLKCFVGSGDLDEKEVSAANKFKHQKPRKVNTIKDVVAALWSGRSI